MSFLKSERKALAGLGKHQVTLKDPENLKGRLTKNTLTEYIPIVLVTEDGREEPITLWENTYNRMETQLRKQLNDNTDYANPIEFLKSLDGKTLDCWISEVTYVSGEGDAAVAKKVRQVDFQEPYVSSDSENNPF